mgnify:CR=1 FL=1
MEMIESILTMTIISIMILQNNMKRTISQIIILKENNIIRANEWSLATLNIRWE